MENENKKNIFSIASLVLVVVAIALSIAAFCVMNEPIKNSTVVKLWGSTSSTLSIIGLVAGIAAFVAAIVGVINKGGSKGLRIASIIVSIIILLGTLLSTLGVSLLVGMTKHYNGDKEALSFIDDEETLNKLDDMIAKIVEKVEENNK